MTIPSYLMVVNNQSADMWMLIMRVIWTKGDLLQVIPLLLQVEKLGRCQIFKK